MTANPEGPRGLGGWITVFLIAQTVAFGVAVYRLPGALTFFSDGTWELGEQIKVLRPILLIETAFHFLGLVGLPLGFYLTLRRSPATPLFWRVFLALLVTYAVVDLMAVLVMRFELANLMTARELEAWQAEMKSAFRQAVRQMAGSLLWLGYWWRSVRVANTFVADGPPPGPSPVARALGRIRWPWKRWTRPAFVARLVAAAVALGSTWEKVWWFWTPEPPAPIGKEQLDPQLISRLELDRLVDLCSTEGESYVCLRRGRPRFLGLERRLAEVEGELLARPPDDGGVYLDLNGDQPMNLVFRPPDSELMVPGLYRGIESIHSEDPWRPRLEVEDFGDPCGEVGGQFAVAELKYATSGEIARFAAAFERRCLNGETVAGVVCYRCDPQAWERMPATPVTVPDGSETIVQTPKVRYTLDDIASACPEDRARYWCFQSETGDAIGGGRRMVLTEDDAELEVRRGADGRHVWVRYRDHHRWAVVFGPPDGEELKPGRYEEARKYDRASFLDLPTLSVRHRGKGCPNSRGWFEVTELAYDAEGGIERFGANFRADL